MQKSRLKSNKNSRSRILVRDDMERAFEIFAEDYKLVPLEVFHKPYEVLVSTLMSSRTNDDTTLLAAKRLFVKAPDVYSLKKLNQSQIEELIYPVGFYKTKAVNLSKLATIIIERYGGIVPNTRAELTKLPGVGVKTANLVLVRAFHKPAISVDTHVHRISNLLGWVKTKTPEQTEKVLTKILPRKYWFNVNRYLVSIGRQYRSKQRLNEYLKERGLI